MGRGGEEFFVEVIIRCRECGALPLPGEGAHRVCGAVMGSHEDNQETRMRLRPWGFVLGAVAMLALQAIAINRLAGIDYPIWALRDGHR